MEKVLSAMCFVAGAVFFIIALLGAWRFFFTMAFCFAGGILISENETGRTPIRRDRK